MFSTSKLVKKCNQNGIETKQSASHVNVINPADPSTSNGPKISAVHAESEENIQARRKNIGALRNRIMRNVKKGINDEKLEKDRRKLIKLEADLAKALTKSMD